MGRSRRFPKAVFSASTLGSNRGEPRNRPRVSQGITVLIWNAVCVAILSRSPIPIVVQYSGDKEPDLPTWQKHEGEISKRNGRRSDKEARSPTRPKIFSMCYFSDIARSGINRAAPKLTLNRLHHTETARYFDKSTSGPRV
jgi:hypothetical protein